VVVLDTQTAQVGDLDLAHESGAAVPVGARSAMLLRRTE
jgi:hypothetical protein